MRSVTPFETEAKASRVDEILSEYDWMIDGTPDEPKARREFWRKEIDKVPTKELLKQHEARSAQQLVAERDQFAPFMQDVGETLAQNLAETLADETNTTAHQIRTQVRDGSSDNGQAPVLGSAPPYSPLPPMRPGKLSFTYHVTTSNLQKSRSNIRSLTDRHRPLGRFITSLINTMSSFG
jgi:hypothetical protein